MDMQESSEDLIDSIDSAFTGVCWPAAQNLPRFEVGTLEEMESAYVIKNFGGKQRDEFEKVMDGSNIEELISMSEHGISYYLPCFLKKLLRDQNDFGFTIGMILLLSNRAVKPGVNILWPEKVRCWMASEWKNISWLS